MQVRVFILLMALVTTTFCISGLDVSNPYTIGDFQCFIKQNANFFIVRAYRQYGTLDPSTVQSLKILKQLGSPSDIYMSNCRSKDPVAQVNEMIDAIPGQLYNTIWIFVQQNYTPGCDWPGFSPQSNCDYLVNLINAVINRGKKVGIYSSQQDWYYVFKSLTACPQAAAQPLWYLTNDGSPSFSNFRTFGGWISPVMKRFQLNGNLCGQSPNYNYKP